MGLLTVSYHFSSHSDNTVHISKPSGSQQSLSQLFQGSSVRISANKACETAELWGFYGDPTGLTWMHPFLVKTFYQSISPSLQQHTQQSLKQTLERKSFSSNCQGSWQTPFLMMGETLYIMYKGCHRPVLCQMRIPSPPIICWSLKATGIEEGWLQKSWGENVLLTRFPIYCWNCTVCPGPDLVKRECNRSSVMGYH